MELRELRGFVAVVEEGGMSAAARRLHVSQSALSQTISNLERELGVKLLVRSSAGVRPTAAGKTFLAEARSVLARYAQAVRTMADYTTEGTGVVRLGVPLELPAALLPTTLARFARDYPEGRVVARHLSTAAQFNALRDDELDVGLVRELPASAAEFDAMLVVRESLGVLVATDVANTLAKNGAIALEALAGLEWIGFPRAGSPAWHDELTATFRAHGVDAEPSHYAHQDLIATVKLVGVSGANAFALAPPNWEQPLPDGVSWSPLRGNPLVRRTWVVWPADSRRRDVAHLINAFDVADV
ncbi:LysR family transcriptional regulator [Mycolicibacterium agri]|uniref:Probable hydrogen peroxide-inducible genes activator n=1 Tax=Mycolicibacterium agri TaxID=36811 RepID=A0A2A7NCE9_MYCAG|nr:LysR family transcriptional regulator [Mycolicibacterium agri]PEG41715.1 LysR family transcriptional regulator [Mycolicibacterium agri]GFG50052.1 LysR family transcriptional regulator [Mycolicibacterium agri]